MDFIGRQPILDRREGLMAYELLFRTAGVVGAQVADHSHATANVIINTLSGFGVDDILGTHKGYINVELDLLMDDALHILPRERVVLELLESIEVTPAVVERCRFLKENGFSLALDDHEYSPAYHELYGIVDIVKVDLLQTPRERLAAMVENLRRYPLQLLAEKVETRDEFEHCLELGFDLFQGYYFSKPSVIHKRHLDDSVSVLLKLMRQLGEDVELAEIERTFRESPVLTYKLLLLVNSVGIGVCDRVQTVRHAIAILGRQQIRRWVQLALFASDDHGSQENPLVDMAAVRAGLMEGLAACHPQLRELPDAAEKAFMTGTLSILEKVYEISMAEVVRKLRLSDDVVEALTRRGGELGKLLDLAELVEGEEVTAMVGSRAFGRVAEMLAGLGISCSDFLASQKRAYNWRAAAV